MFSEVSFISNHKFLKLIDNTIRSVETNNELDIKNIDVSDIRILSIQICKAQRVLQNALDDKEINRNTEIINTLMYLSNIQDLLMYIINKNMAISTKTFLRKINEIKYNENETVDYGKKESLLEKMIKIFVSFSGGALLYMIAKGGIIK